MNKVITNITSKSDTRLAAMASEAHECASTTWGSPEAPKTAVLIHGLASSSQTWLDVAPDLVKKGYYVVAPDLLGHGMAPRSKSYQIEDFVANLLPSVAGRAIDLLVAHSLGGPVSLGLYPHLKNKPQRLVLVDPALEIGGGRMSTVQNTYLNDVKTRPSPEVFQERNPRWTPNACVVKSLASCLASAHAVEYITTEIHPWSFTGGLPSENDAVEIVIIGADPQMNTVFKPEEAEALARSRPDVKCIVASGSGHGIQREQPELIVRAALDPLDSL